MVTRMVGFRLGSGKGVRERAVPACHLVTGSHGSDAHGAERGSGGPDG